MFSRIKILFYTLCVIIFSHQDSYAHSFTHSLAVPFDLNYWQNESKSSIGINYEFRPFTAIGINLWADSAPGKHLDGFIGGGLAFHTPWIEDLRYLLMPGYRYIYRDKFITYRTGIGYETSFSDYFLAGTHLLYDLSPEKPGILFGFTVGFGL